MSALPPNLHKNPALEHIGLQLNSFFAVEVRKKKGLLSLPIALGSLAMQWLQIILPPESLLSLIKKLDSILSPQIEHISDGPIF